MNAAALPTHDSFGVRYEAVDGAPNVERQLLSLCLRSASALPEAMARGVGADWFSSSYQRALWIEMTGQHERGILPDEATLTDALARNDVGPGLAWAEFGEMARWIRDLAAVKVSRSRLEGYIEALAAEHERRRLLEAARRVIMAHNDHQPTDALRQEMAKGLSEAEVRHADTPPTMLEIVREAADRALAQARGDLPSNIVPTELQALDRLFRMRTGDLILVGARPSMGKTHFLLSIAQGAARAGFPVQVQSVEMGTDAIGDRAFGHHAERGWQESVTACETATPSALSVWAHGGAALPIHVDTRSTTLSRIVTAMHVAAQDRGVRVFMIDYLQLVRVIRRDDLRSATREQVVAHISRTLKLTAKALDVLVICAVQLSRALEARPDKRPMMSDLRESGQLEQDADGILLLYRDAVYREEADPGELEIIIGKQRQGERGRTAFLRYTPGDGWVRDPNYREEIMRDSR